MTHCDPSNLTGDSILSLGDCTSTVASETANSPAPHTDMKAMPWPSPIQKQQQEGPYIQSLVHLHADRQCDEGGLGLNTNNGEDKTNISALQDSIVMSDLSDQVKKTQARLATLREEEKVLQLRRRALLGSEEHCIAGDGSAAVGYIHLASLTSPKAVDDTCVGCAVGEKREGENHSHLCDSPSVGTDGTPCSTPAAVRESRGVQVSCVAAKSNNTSKHSRATSPHLVGDRGFTTGTTGSRLQSCGLVFSLVTYLEPLWAVDVEVSRGVFKRLEVFAGENVNEVARRFVEKNGLEEVRALQPLQRYLAALAAQKMNQGEGMEPSGSTPNVHTGVNRMDEKLVGPLQTDCDRVGTPLRFEVGQRNRGCSKKVQGSDAANIAQGGTVQGSDTSDITHPDVKMCGRDGKLMLKRPGGSRKIDAGRNIEEEQEEKWKRRGTPASPRRPERDRFGARRTNSSCAAVPRGIEDTNRQLVRKMEAVPPRDPSTTRGQAARTAMSERGRRAATPTAPYTDRASSGCTGTHRNGMGATSTILCSSTQHGERPIITEPGCAREDEVERLLIRRQQRSEQVKNTESHRCTPQLSKARAVKGSGAQPQVLNCGAKKVSYSTQRGKIEERVAGPPLHPADEQSTSDMESLQVSPSAAQPRGEAERQALHGEERSYERLNTSKSHGSPSPASQKRSVHVKSTEELELEACTFSPAINPRSVHIFNTIINGRAASERKPPLTKREGVRFVSPQSRSTSTTRGGSPAGNRLPNQEIIQRKLSEEMKCHRTSENFGTGKRASNPFHGR
ncbi:uncharacterized protein TEOVI_000888000 [Trypanosoma equiperdum]|uniref:Uncharacterized protein n=3 Tax=Trypanozoon TaxID=39700 RepID=Q583V5_TRYB2|nr:hypothetical protein, conserved [Trypanosoma brucei brucei TREU927]AAX79858.1 hypothetical protein, conserved [Trypanosoma brucei]AAZ10869.1 hypothetical protein, conserved [Trypanosoma brucei brucei TREU927]SCU66223.1 hypothetical protein, conserved [Trypanosoma equiperdum]